MGNLLNLEYVSLDGNQLSSCVPSRAEELRGGNLSLCPEESTSETDREALIALYNATDGENWRDSENWLTDAPLEEWARVTTDERGRVTVLELTDNGLKGKIPPELGSLAKLMVLALEGNRLSGEIPPELGNLANLRHLGLSHNELTGEIPPELGKLTYLRGLYLNVNGLSGTIPPELGNLPALQNLDIYDNRLSGCLPESLEGKVTEYSGIEASFCPEAPRRPLIALIPAAEASPETDREALIALYNATDGESWNDGGSWLTDEPLGDWEGVTTDDRRARHKTGPQGDRVERGDTAGTGQPDQPEIPGPQRQPVLPGHQQRQDEWGDTAGVGQLV